MRSVSYRVKIRAYKSDYRKLSDEEITEAYWSATCRAQKDAAKSVLLERYTPRQPTKLHNLSNTWLSAKRSGRQEALDAACQDLADYEQTTEYKDYEQNLRSGRYRVAELLHEQIDDPQVVWGCDTCQTQTS